MGCILTEKSYEKEQSFPHSTIILKDGPTGLFTTAINYVLSINDYFVSYIR